MNAWPEHDRIIGILPCAGRIIRVRTPGLHEDKAYLSSPDDFFSGLNLFMAIDILILEGQIRPRTFKTVNLVRQLSFLD